MRLGVNGRFLAAPVGGVWRFAREIARGVLAGAGGVLFVPADVEGSDGLLPGARGRPEDVVGAEAGVADEDVAGQPDGAHASMAPPSGRGSAVPSRSGASVRRGRLRGHAWEQIELPGAARRAGCDVVLHLANSVPLRGGPHVATVHDVSPLTHSEWFRPGYVAWHRWIVRPALRRAAALLTVSGWSAGEVARVLDVPPERVHAVPQGAAPMDAPAAPRTVDEVRRRFGLSGRYLLAVGGRDPRKNVAFLTDVLARLADGGSSVPLVLVGGREAGRVWADPPELPAAAPVLRVGEVDDETLRALYTGAAVLCHPALAEGFGRPPLEALACGAPAVVAPYGPVREVLGDAAEVVSLDPDAWAATLQRVMSESPSCRARRVERGRRRAAGHRWEEGVRTVLEVCRAVAGEGRGGAAEPVEGRSGGHPPGGGPGRPGEGPP